METSNDCHLRIAIDFLSQECQREAATLAEGWAGDWVRGRVYALRRVQHWFEDLKCTENSFDLATRITDLIQCLERSVEDERSDARPMYRRNRKKRDARGERRRMAAARGRASAYASVEGVLSRLLTVHYPNQQFPLTLTGGSPDCNERTAEDETLSDTFEPLSDDLSHDERAIGQAEPISADIR